MKEPTIFYVARYEIAEISVTLPNDKVIVFKRGTEYSTEDEEEIAFLTGVKGLGARKMEDKEYRGWATAQFEKLPLIDRHDIKSVQDVEEYLWNSSFEKLIVTFLKSKGWIVKKNEGKPKVAKDKKAKTVATKPPASKQQPNKGA